jgi:hypothetical protein
MNATTMTKAKKQVTKGGEGEYSGKFMKELGKFFEWANEASYVIMCAKDNTERQWNMELMKNFEEPGRNKLEAYIKELQKTYVIWSKKTQEEVEDYKLFAKEFKDIPTKRKRQDTSETSGSEMEILQKEKPVKNELQVTIDEDIDTSETFYIDTLDFSSEQIIEKIGQPFETGQEDDEHTFEWKLKVNGNVYTIYDWDEKDMPLQDKTWHLGGTVVDKKEISAIKKYLKGEVKKVVKKAKVTESELNKRELKECEPNKNKRELNENDTKKRELNESECDTNECEMNEGELFGDDDDDCDSVQINLDDLSFDD